MQSNLQKVVAKFREMPLAVPPGRMIASKYRNTVMDYITAPMVDRTQSLPDTGFHNIQILQKIPSKLYYVGDFADIVDRRVKQISIQALERQLPIAVLYSGGMDSTCVVSAFLKAGQPIHIIGSQASIEENPDFFNMVLLDNHSVAIHIGNPLLMLKEHKDDFIWVTGECGAHLMGTINWTKFGGREIEVTDSIEADHLASDIFRNPEPYFNVPEELRTILNKVLDCSPVRMPTNYDAQWWAIFALKWQFVSFRTQMWVGEICENLINFFMSDEFQIWALTNDSRVKCPDFEWRNYKMPIRDYIYKFFPSRAASYDLPKRASFDRTYSRLRLHDTFVIAEPLKIGWLTRSAREAVATNLTKLKGQDVHTI